MANTFIQRSFAGGEVAPAIFGRADQTKYQTGLATCRNFIVRRHGGISNRPGLQYITPQNTHSAQGRLAPFIFNADQTYVLLFENLTLRFIRNGALITVSGVVAYNGATAYVIGDLASSGGVNYYCIANTTGNAPPNATYWYAMPAGNIYEIPTPYVTADLPDLYFSQSADVVTITHDGYDIYDLSRFGHTDWTLQPVAMAPSIAAPGSLSVSGGAGTVAQWVATAVKTDTLEESLPSASAGANSAPSSGSPRTLTIGAVSGAQEYFIYRDDGNGIYGLIGTSAGPTFIDTGIVPDFNETPPTARDPFTATDDHPAISGYLQQRKCYGGSLNDPETVRASKTGQYTNFTKSSPLQDDDAADWTPASSEVNTIRHVLEVGESFILTAGAEWVAFGDGNGVLTPGSPGLKKQSSYGSAEIAPVVIGNSFLFVQARATIVRDIKYEANSNGYTGRDLTVFSPHLFEGFTIVRWAYAQIPHSIVWAVRSDGVLLSLTYLREHEIWGWARHDTDGYIEDAVVVPESQEDVLYVLVRRTIGGATKRYVERLYTRTVLNDGLNSGSVAVDARFMDSHLSYDGRLTSDDGLTLSGGTDWLATEDLTLTYAGASYFTAGDVGNAFRLELYTTTYTPDGGTVETVETLTCTVIEYTSVTEVTVNANKTVPVAFRNVEIGEFARCVDQVTGLDHLEGKTVAILADGNVVSNGVDEPLYTVSGGQLSADLETPAAVIHVGLPYFCDAQTLDLELIGSETLADKGKHVPVVTVQVESTRGFWAGEPNTRGEIVDADLYEYPQRQVADEYGTIRLFTGKDELSIKSSWNRGGRVVIRQKDPLPLTILSLMPTVDVGG